MIFPPSHCHLSLPDYDCCELIIDISEIGGELQAPSTNSSAHSTSTPRAMPWQNYCELN